MADQVQALGYTAELVSVDIIAPAAKQEWPICVNEQDSSEARSLDEVWNKHFSDLRLASRYELENGGRFASALQGAANLTSSLWTPGTTCILFFTISPTVACCLQKTAKS